MRNFIGEVTEFWRKNDASRVSLWNSGACNIPHTIHEYGKSLMSLGRDAGPSARDVKPSWTIIEHSFSVPNRDIGDVVENVAPALVEQLFRNGGCIWLDSASAHNPQSQYSFMSAADFVVSYSMSGALEACVRHGPQVTRSPVAMNSSNLWDWLDQVQGTLHTMTQAQIDPPTKQLMCPFRTGFAGFFSYEMKDESLELGNPPNHYEDDSGCVNRMHLPLAQWAFCNTVLSFDHLSCTWTGYALVRTGQPEFGPEDGALNALDEALHAAGANVSIGISGAYADSWFDRVGCVLEELYAINIHHEVPPVSPIPPLDALDGHDEYTQRIKKAQELISRGESYELCLTTQFEGTIPELDAARDKYAAYFDLYVKLRNRNPAPFGAYIELLPTPGGVPQAILSTSPERFLTITQGGNLEMRPIKGTLVRPGHTTGEEGWLQEAKGDAAMRRFVEYEDERRKLKLNGDIKERGENLMIADLIRADLQSICYPDSVKVPRLIAIETYETVHQLVTSVIGKMRPGIGSVEATRRCFPPGSMTGAPKKRSVQLLEQLERTPGFQGAGCTRRRGIYSGTLGFIGVDGGANFSVVIRTLTVQGAGVVVGAGGAVTFLSTPEGEWAEVVHKLGSITTMAT